MTSTPESITRDELEAYYKRMTHGDGMLAADRVFASILAHREPAYEPYEIYECGGGRRWEFYADEDGQRGWLLPGNAARYGFDFPARPLRKLVPLPSHDDLVAVLIESITHDVSGYEGQARRVLKLLEGGSHD